MNETKTKFGGPWHWLAARYSYAAMCLMGQKGVKEVDWSLAEGNFLCEYDAGEHDGRLRIT